VLGVGVAGTGALVVNSKTLLLLALPPPPLFRFALRGVTGGSVVNSNTSLLFLALFPPLGALLLPLLAGDRWASTAYAT
jgi:hypothetical protein